jgi:hypothetical protein
VTHVTPGAPQAVLPCEQHVCTPPSAAPVPIFFFFRLVLRLPQHPWRGSMTSVHP